MTEIVQPSNARKFNQKRWPIIEYAFEDIRVYKKIHAVKEKRQGEQQEEKELANKIENIQKKELKQKEKLTVQNDKRYVKVKLEEMKENPALATKAAVLDLVKMVKKNRGLKQKIKKRYSQFFEDEQNANHQALPQSKSTEPRQKKEKTQLAKRVDPLRQEEDKIMKKIKKQKALKNSREDFDHLDVDLE